MSEVEKLRIENEYLRAENDFLKKLEALAQSKQAKKKKTVIITELRRKHKLEYLLHIAELARSSYYYHTKSVCFIDKHADLVRHVIACYQKHKGRYGYRRVTLALRNTLDKAVNYKTIAKIMRLLKLKSVIRVKKYKSYKGDVGIAADKYSTKKF
ncbi:IS3 family transposase [Sphingobacterium sp. T2]|uniref:IS3 family transposase n=1 Tax=Sphingobacterium sp. T2 TaxID=1590596 RepID=UPI0006920B9A|nr:IS3 family transposase [Sphingobacterium sp. T2]